MSSSVVSCESLKRQGVSYSGIFNLKDESGNLRLGYCNMEKGLEDADLEEDTLWQFGSGSGSTQPYPMGPSTSRPVLTNGSIQISRDDCNFGSIQRNNVTFDIDYGTSQDCYMVISGFPSTIRNMVLTFENFNVRFYFQDVLLTDQLFHFSLKALMTNLSCTRANLVQVRRNCSSLMEIRAEFTGSGAIPSRTGNPPDPLPFAGKLMATPQGQT